ncbi:MAG TPA: tryptophan 7-halogenase [Allosphingosinicella sp.]|nr:tryptophan 7-halogenase [Allosphingosinicella sp.]
MSRDERAIRSLCVVGGGVVGFSAALAFARALPSVEVKLICTPTDPAALADRIGIGLTAIHRFHAAIGVDELELVGGRVALHHLGTIFEGWSADREPWAHVFGEYGLAAAGVPFHQIWAKLRRANKGQSFDHYAAAARLAVADKFVHPEEDSRSPLSTFLYGLRLDPAAYRAMLVERAGKLGIEIVDGAMAGVERRQDGKIASVRLVDDRAFEADLFLDCGGPAAPLRSLLDDEFEDWGAYLPSNRFSLGAARPSAAALPADRVGAVPEGWWWRSALPDHLATGMSWHSDATNEQAVMDRLDQLLQVDSAELLTIRPGRRLEPWKHNVLALGDSAVVSDPLYGPGLHLAQSAILRALELLPGRDCHPLELREYNRRTAQETARVRDFQALHYLRSGRREGEFWNSASNRSVSDSLSHSLDQYETRGRLPFYEEESFEPESWLAVLGGLSVLPHRTDPASDRIDPEEALRAMTELSARLASLPARLPTYPDYLRRIRDRPR